MLGPVQKQFRDPNFPFSVVETQCDDDCDADDDDDDDDADDDDDGGDDDGDGDGDDDDVVMMMDMSSLYVCMTPKECSTDGCHDIMLV